MFHFIKLPLPYFINVYDKAIDSAVKLTADAIRGEDMNTSLKNEMQQVKRKAADVIENVNDVRKKQRKAAPKPKTKPKMKAKPAKIPVKAMNDIFE